MTQGRRRVDARALVLEALDERQGRTVKELTAATGLSPAAVAFNLTHLVLVDRRATVTHLPGGAQHRPAGIYRKAIL